MILCVTPNVAVDRTYVVPTVQLGAVLRSAHTIVVAGGKGLNVARAIGALGEEALVMGLLGGRSGELVAELADEEGFTARWTWVSGETRNCAILVGEDGSPATVINDRGGPLAGNEWLQFIQDVVDSAQGLPLPNESAPVQKATAVCICGSLPPGVPPHAPADLIEALLATGTPVWLDSSGAGLRHALDARPTGLKINNEEAGALLGQRLAYLDDVHNAARTLRRRGIDYVVITLGARGAVLHSPRGEYHLRPPLVQAISAVGSGDAFLGGLLVALSRGLPDPTALAWGVAAGAANTLIPGGGRFTRLAEHAPGVSFDALVAGIGSPDVAGAIGSQLGDMAMPEAAYRAAMDEHRPAMRRIYGQVFEAHGLDAIVFPTTPLPARPIGGDETVTLNGEQVPTFPTYIRNTDLGSNIGAPGISLPCPVSSGLPVGIEFDALPGNDRSLLALARAAEKAMAH